MCSEFGKFFQFLGCFKKFMLNAITFVRICEEIQDLAKSFKIFCLPGSTLHGYLSKILARSCQDFGKILAKVVTKYCQELQDAMVRSYQESHVSKKNLTEKSYLERKKNLKGSQQTSTFLQIYIVRH